MNLIEQFNPVTSYPTQSIAYSTHSVDANVQYRSEFKQTHKVLQRNNRQLVRLHVCGLTHLNICPSL